MKFEHFKKRLEERYTPPEGTNARRHEDIAVFKKKLGEVISTELSVGTSDTTTNRNKLENIASLIKKLTGVIWESRNNFLHNLKRGRGSDEVAFALYFLLHAHKAKNEDTGVFEYPHKKAAHKIDQLVFNEQLQDKFQGLEDEHSEINSTPKPSSTIKTKNLKQLLFNIPMNWRSRKRFIVSSIFICCFCISYYFLFIGFDKEDSNIEISSPKIHTSKSASLNQKDERLLTRQDRLVADSIDPLHIGVYVDYLRKLDFISDEAILNKLILMNADSSLTKEDIPYSFELFIEAHRKTNTTLDNLGSPAVSAAIKLAKSHIKDGQPEQAIQSLLAVIKTTKKNLQEAKSATEVARTDIFSIYLNLGNAYQTAEKYELAAEYKQKASNYAGDDALALALRAEAEYLHAIIAFKLRNESKLAISIEKLIQISKNLSAHRPEHNLNIIKIRIADALSKRYQITGDGKYHEEAERVLSQYLNYCQNVKFDNGCYSILKVLSDFLGTRAKRSILYPKAFDEHTQRLERAIKYKKLLVKYSEVIGADEGIEAEINLKSAQLDLAKHLKNVNDKKAYEEELTRKCNDIYKGIEQGQYNSAMYTCINVVLDRNTLSSSLNIEKYIQLTSKRLSLIERKKTTQAISNDWFFFIDQLAEGYFSLWKKSGRIDKLEISMDYSKRLAEVSAINFEHALPVILYEHGISVSEYGRETGSLKNLELAIHLFKFSADKFFEQEQYNDRMVALQDMHVGLNRLSAIVENDCQKELADLLRLEIQSTRDFLDLAITLLSNDTLDNINLRKKTAKRLFGLGVIARLTDKSYRDCFEETPKFHQDTKSNSS